MHCSDDFLTGCRDLAREFDVGIQTHLAESATQAVIARKRYGKSLTAHLAALDMLDERFSGAHAIWIDRDDMRRIADAGGAVAHNPLSNLRLGSGLAAVRAMLDCGVTVGIGTDAGNTSDTQNMFEAARLASYLSRIRGPDYREWLTAAEAFTLASAGSARVLGFGDEMGAIAPNAFADLVFLDLAHINYVPLRDALLQLVNGESGTAIDAVMVGGRFVLRGGKLLTVDEAKMRREAEAARERLDTANAGALQTRAQCRTGSASSASPMPGHPACPTGTQASRFASQASTESGRRLRKYAHRHRAEAAPKQSAAVGGDHAGREQRRFAGCDDGSRIEHNRNAKNRMRTAELGQRALLVVLREPRLERREQARRAAQHLAAEAERVDDAAVACRGRKLRIVRRALHERPLHQCRGRGEPASRHSRELNACNLTVGREFRHQRRTLNASRRIEHQRAGRHPEIEEVERRLEHRAQRGLRFGRVRLARAEDRVQHRSRARQAGCAGRRLRSAPTAQSTAGRPAPIEARRIPAAVPVREIAAAR